MGRWSNFTKAQKTPRPGPEVAGERRANGGTPERLRCRTVEKEMRKTAESVRRRCENSAVR